MHTPGRACTDKSLTNATRMYAHTIRCRWTDLPLHARQTNMHHRNAWTWTCHCMHATRVYTHLRVHQRVPLHGQHMHIENLRVHARMCGFTSATCTCVNLGAHTLMCTYMPATRACAHLVVHMDMCCGTSVHAHLGVHTHDSVREGHLRACAHGCMTSSVQNKRQNRSHAKNISHLADISF